MTTGPGPGRRAIPAAAIAFGFLIAIAWGRELRIGARAMADSDAAMARHDPGAALSFARDAAVAAAPWSPYPRAGFARIEALARDAEARGDARAAVVAWSALRAAATATRSPFTSNAPLRALADDGVARAGSRPDPSSTEVRAGEPLLRASLARDDAPSPFTFALLGGGALAFFAGALRLAFAARDLPSLRRERVAAVVAAAGLAAYLVASRCF